MITEKASRKIKALSFVAMVCVVMIHSHALGTHENPAAWCVFVQTLLMRAMTSWAVPFFFAVSGFFFARALGDGFSRVGGYGKFLLKKARTLLTPYLCWAVIGTAIGLPIILVNNYLTHRPLLDRTFLASGGLWQCLDVLFGIASYGPSGNLALWYVRTLMVFFLFAPLWSAIWRLARWMFLPIGIAAVVLVPDVTIPLLAVKMSSVGWLSLGIFARSCSLHERRLPKMSFAAAGVLYAVTSLAVAMHKADAAVCGATMAMSAGAVIPFVGIAFWWGLADRVGVLFGRHSEQLLGMTFWTYCLHGSITGWFLATVSYLFGKGDLSAMVASAASIAGTLAICLISGLVVKRFLPRLYAVLSGGR